MADFGGKPNFYACSNPAPGTVPVYRGLLTTGTDLTLEGLHMNALDINDFPSNNFLMEAAGKPFFYAYLSPVAGTTPVYRRGNPTNSDRILTKEVTEGDPWYFTEKSGALFHAFTSAS